MPFINPKTIVIAVVAISLSIAGLLYFKSQWYEPTPLVITDHEGVIIESPPTPLPDFQLVNQANNSVSKQIFEDKWSLLFFGYMNCPDICPGTLDVFTRVKKHFNVKPEIAKKLQFIFASVDPKRDTADKISEFLRYFDQEFIGLTGTKQNIDRLTQRLGVVYEYEGDTQSEKYIVNHFAAIYVIDPNANSRAYILPPHNQQRVSDIVNRIIQYYD